MWLSLRRHAASLSCVLLVHVIFSFPGREKWTSVSMNRAWSSPSAMFQDCYHGFIWLVPVCNSLEVADSPIHLSTHRTYTQQVFSKYFGRHIMSYLTERRYDIAAKLKLAHKGMFKACGM